MIGKVGNCLVARLGACLVALSAAVLLTVATACGTDSSASSTGPESPVTVRLGHFPNVTHATATVGVEKGIFAASLGADKLEVKTFNAGPAAVEALLSGGLDATYIGPNPAINAFVKSDGKAVRIISGATSGGAALVVKPDVADAAALRAKMVASPQLGGTQDVALRQWLAGKDLKTTPQGGGDVSVVPQENAQTLETFKAGQIDGAWVPEPWATRLVQEAGGKVLVDERELWPDGQFVTTHLLVRTEFLKDHPGAVRRLLQGQVEANRFIAERPDEAKQVANRGITKITGKGLATAVIDSAWQNLSFTNDPIASSLATSAEHATEVGLLPKADIGGIYDLTLLNEVLRTANQPEVKGQ